MGHYETDAEVLAWFDAALVHETAYVRRTAVSLLGHVDCVQREQWLRRATSDGVPDVAAMAILVSAAVAATGGPGDIDLFESDFADTLMREDLEWEWEYQVAIAHGQVVQSGTRTVWTAAEDDALARSIALERARSGIVGARDDMVAIIVDKRLVNQFTRLPRSNAESAIWRRLGRPRYSE